MKKKSLFKRTMAYIVTIVLVIGLMNGFVFKKEVKAANWYAMPKSWQSDYRNWNQGTSKYAPMRSYGCLVTAQAKMLYEVGVNRGGLNPDVWYEYLLNNGGLKNMYMQPKGFSSLVKIYAAKYGKTVDYLGSWSASNNQLWFNINAGYYTIINVGGHYVMLDNQTSKSTGTLYIYDSANGAYGISSPLSLASRYSGRVEGHVYKTSTPPPTKPDTPKNVKVNKTDIGLGDAISVTWSAAARATKYNVKLTCTSNSSYNQSKSVGGTSTSFSINKAGTYKVSVSASNSAGTSGEGSSGNFEAHPNVIVKYVDWNGDIIGKEQSVKWGGNAKAPAPPEREGYTFQNWSSDGKGIKTNIVIEALYKINTYAVSFVDYKGDVIGKVQKVEWSSAAEEPTDIPTKNGYIFAGWDTSDYKCVKKALTVKATYVWENTDLPIITEIESAKRNEEATGYDIKVNLTNFPNDFTKGKLVFTLMTKEGKMVASEIKSISMPETEEISETATILYSGLASRVQVSMIGVVDDDTTGTPKAKVVTAPVDVGNKWSDWLSVMPTGEDIITESRDEYRYKDSKVVKSETTPATPDGYSLISKVATGTYTAWGAWSGWSDTKITGNTLKEVGTQSVVASYKTEYNYKRYLSADGKTSGPTNGTWGGKACNRYQERGWGGQLACTGSQNSNQAGFFYLYGSAPCWYYPWTRQVAASYKTQYRYRTRLEYYNYTYKQNEFSDWQPEEVSASDTREVETRKGYRFKTNSTEVPCYNYKRYKYTNINNGKVVYSYTSSYADSMDYPGEWEYKTEFEELEKVAIVDDDIELYNGTGENSWYKADVNGESNSTVFETKSSLEDQSGIKRTFEGNQEGAAGKVATLMVYKGQNTDPIASQIEYIGQVKIGDDGSYRFEYVTKEEPSIKTGDFVITLGIEGSTNYQVVGKIEAPKPVYTVNFVDDEGNSIGEQKKVAAGGTVEAPEVPEKEGFEFIGWDTGLKNVRENMVITAQYEKKKCTVIFVDWDQTSIEIKEFEYGDTLSSDNIPEKAGQVFDKWVDEENNEVKVVKENMVVEATYKDTKYIVKFVDWNGDVISEQELNYGEEAELPKEPEAPNDKTEFLCWDNYDQIGFVQSDVLLTPKFQYTETTDKPLFVKSEASNETEQIIGLYSLNSDVEIFYRIEDSEEELGTTQFLDKEEYQKYTKPLVIDSDSIIRAYATTDNANDSEIAEYFVDFSGQESTTEEPTTEEPTTIEPTQVEPTTAAPTTIEPTTVQPTTTEPETPAIQPPAKPEGLQGVVDKANNYNLFWASSSGANYYNVYVKGELVGNTISPNFRIPASFFVTNGEYKVEVEAVNTAGASDKASITYIVDNVVPTTIQPTTVAPTTAEPTTKVKATKPSNLQGIVDKNDNYYIYWDASANASYYRIYVNDELIGNTVSTNYRIPASYFVKNGEYLIEVEAVNEVGSSDRASATYIVKVEETTPEPTTPNVTTQEVSTQENTTKQVETTGTIVVPTTKESVTNAPTVKPTEKTTNKVAVAKPSLKKLLNKKKRKVSVRWVTKTGASGYHIQYARDKKFTKKLKSKTINNPFVNKATIKKLKYKKTYYFRLRAFKKVDGIKHFSLWSNVRKIKIRK